MARRLAPTVGALALVSLANDVASEMVYPLLPALVTTGLGGGPLALGVLDGASDLTASLLRWWSGRAADRPHARAGLIGAGYLLAVVTRPVSALAERAWQVVAIRVTDRIGKGIRSPARDAMIADVTEPALLGRAFGLHRSADHLGAVLGSLIAFELLRRGWAVRSVIAASLWPGLAALLALGVALALARRTSGAARATDSAPETPAAAPSSPPTPSAAATTAAEPAAWGRIHWLAAMAACRLPETLLLYRLQQLGAPIAMIPLIWGLTHIVKSASAYPAGLVADRLGPKPALALGGALHAVVLLAIGLSAAPGLAVALFLGHGVVGGLTEPAERAAVARLVPTRRGAAFGRFQAISGAGALLAGLAFGAIYQRVGAAFSFGAAALVTLLVVAGWSASERRVAA